MANILELSKEVSYVLARVVIDWANLLGDKRNKLSGWSTGG